MPENQPQSPQPRRRWFQFRLRTLLLSILVVSFPLLWASNERQRTRERYEALTRVAKWIDAPRRAEWHRLVFGDNSLEYCVGFGGTSSFSDADSVHLSGLGCLQQLSLERTQVTDASLVHLKGLSQLRRLSLNHTHVTDDGLVHLKPLRQLGELSLNNTQITDAGLVHLNGLGELRELNLFNTDVTGAGIAELQKALPNCRIRP